MYYAICKQSHILFRYPMNATPELLSYALACAKDARGADGVVLERHTPHPDGLITEIISE
jgi:hypothetical protein